MNDEDLTLIEFIRSADLATSDYLPDKSSPYISVIRTFYKSEILKRIPKSIEQLALEPIEILFLAILIVRFEACRDIVRRVAQLWGSSIEEILSYEGALDNSLTHGSLAHFVDRSERSGRFIINPLTKHELFELLVEGYRQI